MRIARKKYNPALGYNYNNIEHAFPKILNFTVNDVYIFCCTKYFLSDSLEWAIRENRDCCTLITDVDEFSRRITEHFQKSLNYIGALECKYTNRCIDVRSAIPYGTYHDILTEPLLSAFIKPTNYRAQRELRVMWSPKDMTMVEEYVRDDINITDLLIPIYFNEFDHNYKNHDRYSIGVIVKDKKGNGIAEYNIKKPYEVFSPVITIDHSTKQKSLGFQVNSNVLNGATISTINGPGTLVIRNKILICNVNLDDVGHIEIYNETESDLIE